LQKLQQQRIAQLEQSISAEEKERTRLRENLIELEAELKKGICYLCGQLRAALIKKSTEKESNFERERMWSDQLKYFEEREKFFAKRGPQKAKVVKVVIPKTSFATLFEKRVHLEISSLLLPLTHLFMIRSYQLVKTFKRRRKKEFCSNKEA